MVIRVPWHTTVHTYISLKTDFFGACHTFIRKSGFESPWRIDFDARIGKQSNLKTSKKKTDVLPSVPKKLRMGSQNRPKIAENQTSDSHVSFLLLAWSPRGPRGAKMACQGVKINSPAHANDSFGQPLWPKRGQQQRS